MVNVSNGETTHGECIKWRDNSFTLRCQGQQATVANCITLDTTIQVDLRLKVFKLSKLNVTVQCPVQALHKCNTCPRQRQT